MNDGQTTNEEIMAAANALTAMGSDVAALLVGIHANHPDPPLPATPDQELGTLDPADVVWYSPFGLPDYAYGEALRIARAVNSAMASTAEMVENLGQWKDEGKL